MFQPEPIYKWVCPLYASNMTARVSLDKAGRVVLPKAVREEMQLVPGDKFVLENEGERITLRPIRAQPLLRKERGVWVYQGERTDASISDILDRQRAQRLAEVIG